MRNTLLELQGTYENQGVKVTSDPLKEEQLNANSVFSDLRDELHQLETTMPYPDVEKYDIADTLEERIELTEKKEQNRQVWDAMKRQNQYLQKGNLYSGHVQIGGMDYYLMDNNLETRMPNEQNGVNFGLINVDDAKCKDFLNAWLYPQDFHGVSLSRNVQMSERKITSVEDKYDVRLRKNDEIYDSFLINALNRSKDNAGVKSIIQTIQKKQDVIRQYSADKSFIVQGCAGSGKTMILLHRLRYLLYNEKINPSEYLVLVPSTRFGNFISDIARDFNISLRKLIPVKTYYQRALGKKGQELDETDIDENHLGNEFLKVVYSEPFMQEQYSLFWEEIIKQKNALAVLCENSFIKLEKNEREALNKKEKENKDEALYKIKGFSKIYIANISSLPKISDFDSIPVYIDSFEKTINEKKESISLLTDSMNQIDDSDNDLQTDCRVISSLGLVNQELEMYNRSQGFFKDAHAKRLEHLRSEYQKVVSIVKKEIQEKRIEEKRKESIGNLELFEGVSFSEAKKHLEKVRTLWETTVETVATLKKEENELASHIENQYSDIISTINKLITDFDIESLAQKNISRLASSSELLNGLINSFKCLYSFIRSNNEASEFEKIKSQISIFDDVSNEKTGVSLYVLLMKFCQNSIKEKLNQSIEKECKHYWYLSLYSNYLTRELRNIKNTHIFIDECQDLSIAEINLISKINAKENKDKGTIEMPILNAFGDINQTISGNGILDWNNISLIRERFELDENFRNTNQIIDYCNKKLSVKMKKVGVDMDFVSEYATLNEALSFVKDVNGAAWIVKDKKTKKDLEIEFEKSKITNNNIYTVSEAKGLEFKEVYVFSGNMMENEKYIAFTRALIKLNVISTLPDCAEM